MKKVIVKRMKKFSGMLVPYIEIADDATNLFVSTMDGSLSNEIDIDEYITAEKNIIINTKGGFRTIPYPVIE